MTSIVTPFLIQPLITYYIEIECHQTKQEADGATPATAVKDHTNSMRENTTPKLFPPLKSKDFN